MKTTPIAERPTIRFSVLSSWFSGITEIAFQCLDAFAGPLLRRVRHDSESYMRSLFGRWVVMP